MEGNQSCMMYGVQVIFCGSGAQWSKKCTVGVVLGYRPRPLISSLFPFISIRIYIAESCKQYESLTQFVVGLEVLLNGKISIMGLFEPFATFFFLLF